MSPRYSSRFLALLACLLLGAARPASAQFLWQRAVGTAQRDETAAQMIPVAGGFVTAGSYFAAAGYRTGLYLTKVSPLGDTLWTKRWAFRRVSAFDPRGLLVDAAGNLVVSAITADPIAVPTPPPFDTRGLLIKLTPGGDTLWTRTVSSPGPNGAHLTVLVPGNDGSYVAIGQLAPALPALFKFSPAGVLLWTQVIPYDNTRPGYLQNLVAVPNGYFLVSSPNGGNLKSKYITVDETGAYQFERMGRRYYPSELRRDSQGNILAIGGDLTKLTVQGDSVWTTTYFQYGALLGLSRLVELANGRYLAAGTRRNGATRDVGIVVLDRDGALLRDTLFVRNGADEAPPAWP